MPTEGSLPYASLTFSQLVSRRPDIINAIRAAAGTPTPKGRTPGEDLGDYLAITAKLPDPSIRRMAALNQKYHKALIYAGIPPQVAVNANITHNSPLEADILDPSLGHEPTMQTLNQTVLALCRRRT